MSGVEVAGLLLGAFPLIISAMEHYQDVKKPTAIWWKIKKAHNKDYNRVKECEIFFRDQLELLLYPLLDDQVLDAPHYEQLLADPGGEGWKESHVEDALTERLQHRYIPYTKVLQELTEAMEKLCKASKVDDPHFQVLLKDPEGHGSSAGSDSHARKALMTKANVAFQGKRIKYSFTGLRRTELLEEVESCIRRLRNLLQASTDISGLTRSHKRAASRPVSEKLLGFWQHADRIFKLLQTAWTCNCRGKAHLWLQHHYASVDAMKMQLPLCHGRQPMQVRVRAPTLQLKRRPLAALDANSRLTANVRMGTSSQTSVPIRTSSSTSQSVVCASSVGLSIQTAHTAVTAVLLPPDPQTTNMTATSGADICKSFGSPCAANECVCILQEGDDEYGVYFANEDSQVPSTISISECLASSDLTRVQRYQIALALASSHLQLHSSPWLQHSWKSQSVRLPMITDAPDSRITHAQPFLLADLDEAAVVWPKKDSSFISLGIVLLELCFNQIFADHKLWRNYPGKENDPLLQQAIAQQWAEKVAEEAGEDYELAVKWALKEAPIETDGDGWRIDFAENVVQPLQRCCESLKPRK